MYFFILIGNCHTSSIFRTRKYSIEMGSSSTKIRNGETENYSISRNCNDYEMNKQNGIDSVLFQSTIGAEFFYRFIHSYIHSTYLPTYLHKHLHTIVNTECMLFECYVGKYTVHCSHYPP